MRDRIARQPVLGEGSTPDVPPAAFGRFKLLHHIRDGSLGPVFRAEDPDSEQPVTIQQLRIGASPALLRRITEGLKALVGSMPDHPSVPRVLEVGDDANHPYIVTTNFDGDTLDEALREYGPAEIEDALPRLRALAKALDKAATLGVWHGRLQPRDVVIAANATGLTGLGIAPVLERAGARIATQPAYAAPEVLEGHPSSPAGDQFSLAAVAYEWLFGRRIPDVPSSMIEVPVVADTDHHDLTYTFRSALATDPAGRFESCGAFVEAIANSTLATKDSAGPSSTSDGPSFSGTQGTLGTLGTPGISGTVGTVGTPGLSPTTELSTDDLYFASEPAAGEASATGAAGAAGAGGGVSDGILWREPAPSPQPVEQPLFEEDRPLSVEEPALYRSENAVPPEAPVAMDDEPVETSDRPVVVAPEPKVLTFDPPIQEPVPPVSWPGSVSSSRVTTVDRHRRFTGSTLAAVLVVGFAAGVGTGYTVGTRNQQPTAAAAAEGTTSAAPAGGREFTDAAVPASPPTGPAAAPTEPRAGASPQSAPPARTGNARLLIRSTPAGAAVTVDGAPRGNTPLTLRDLDIGTRKVVVSRPGYANAERSVTLTKDRPSRSLDVRLSPLRGEAARQARRLPVPPPATTGSLFVDSRPAGAAVTIDGRASGKTPLTVPSVAAGSYVVRIELGGYTPVTTTVGVKAGERARVAATLERGQQE